MAVMRLPFEDRMPSPGDRAQVVLVDLHAATEHVVYETAGFEAQMGANLNWGHDDHTLLFNDVDTTTWRSRIVKLDPLRKTHAFIPGGVYHVSPDGRYAAAADMAAMRRTQYGYGVLVRDELVPRNIGPRDDEGLWITDLQTGARKLLLSLRQAVRYIPELENDRLEDWEIYGFHTKWNPQGDRLIFSIRRFKTEHGGGYAALQHVRFDVLTLKPDGTEIHNAVPANQWAKGGHHINFCPDGEHLSMNLDIHGQGMRLCRVRYDGSGLAAMHDDVLGSGHPTVHPDGRHVLTDTYTWETPLAFGDGTVPLRWIDLTTGRDRHLVRIGGRTDPQPDPAMRVDPHPAWDRTWQWIAFNGVASDNTRRVFIADMRSLLA